METLKQGILCYVSNLIFFWFSSLTYTTRVTTIERKYFLHFILFWPGNQIWAKENAEAWRRFPIINTASPVSVTVRMESERRKV